MHQKLQVESAANAAAHRYSTRYAAYVLVLFVLVYVFNFIDRQILAVLAERVKADLALTDEQLGFLLGTSFAVFYAIFGIPLGRVADLGHRRNLVATGLALWSSMTALSALARSFWSLSIFRFGVGIGEASASPAIYSLLFDYFQSRWRTTAIAIYSGGAFLGAGIGMVAGAQIVDAWEAAFPIAQQAPLQMQGWHAALLAVGLPGLLLAVLLLTVKEPPRPTNEATAYTLAGALRLILRECAAITPIAATVLVTRLGGVRAGAFNLVLMAMVIFAAWVLILLTGSTLQWSAIGAGVYALLSWAHAQSIRDPALFDQLFRRRVLMYSNLGIAGCVFMSTGMLAWLAPFFERVHGQSIATTGTLLGASYAIAGFAGVSCGGLIADRWSLRVGAKARLQLALVSTWIGAVVLLGVLTVQNTSLAYALCVPFHFFSAMYLGPGAANVNHLVAPRLRAVASAAYIATLVLLGNAMGPYAIGKLSDVLAAQVPAPQALRSAMLISLAAILPATWLLHLALRSLAREEAMGVHLKN